MNFREWALPFYTILIQLVVGMFVFLWLIRAAFRRKVAESHLDEMAKIPVLIFVFTSMVAILGSHFHLSHPLKSLLALSNIRTSWLSREIAFTVLFLLFSTALLVNLVRTPGSFRTRTLLGWGAVASGLATVWCMASIYLIPTQESWDTGATVLSYFGTTFLLGVLSLFVVLLMDIGFSSWSDQTVTLVKSSILKRSQVWFMAAAVIAGIWVVAVNIYQVALLSQSELASARTSLQLLTDLYQPLVILRFILLGAGLACFVICSTRLIMRKQGLSDIFGSVYIACLFVMVSEILERFLFYAVHVRIGF